ncbi:hypothetical protein BDR26DRAFT_892218 [Obelidium mucronatum]|nr:hypothetical protein BDR26DRAFT_892218 [Obelidium mucronatum]
MSFRQLQRLSRATRPSSVFSCGGSLAVPTSAAIFNQSHSVKPITSLNILDFAKTAKSSSSDSLWPKLQDFLQEDSGPSGHTISQISTNLDLVDLLKEVKCILAPNTQGLLEAQLSHLQVNSVMQNIVKRDESSNKNPIGSLILELPSYYTGSTLHQTSTQLPPAILQLSNGRHLMLIHTVWPPTVTDGCRVTLRYSLFQDPPPPPISETRSSSSIDVEQTEIYKSLEAVMRNPELRGAKIGIPVRQYGQPGCKSKCRLSGKCDCARFRDAMKCEKPVEFQGGDRIVQLAVQQLGLEYGIFPIFRNYEFGANQENEYLLGSWSMVESMIESEYWGHDYAHEMITNECVNCDDIEWIEEGCFTEVICEDQDCFEMMVGFVIEMPN